METRIELTQEKKGNYVIVKGKGSVVSENIDYFLNYFNDLVNEGEKYIIFDMSDVTYINSNGIGIVLHTFKNLMDKNGNLFMCNVTEDVREIMNVIGASNILTIHENISTVLEAHQELVTE